MNHSYLAVVCDDDGIDRGGPVHRVVTNEEGESEEGTCPILLAKGCWFISIEETALEGRPLCRRCCKARDKEGSGGERALSEEV